MIFVFENNHGRSAEPEPVYQFYLSLFLLEIFETGNCLFIVGGWIFRHLLGAGLEKKGFGNF